ncbi:MED6-domain-containing protein [Whalleya microplaca]|nr:MED6-domain-containing protein [Whalleya microplaca]
MAGSNEPPLDEIQWRDPALVAEMQGIHSNSVLFYFAASPFFDRQSNNAFLTNQFLYNPEMTYILHTRERFEAALRQASSGIEFMVAQEPAETAPGTGTGVWVIHKQYREKMGDGLEDKITVLATYYVNGENVYMAPTFADILSFRLVTISTALSKCFPAADAARSWSPSTGHVYKTTPSSTDRRALESKGATPMPESQGGKGSSTTTTEPKKTSQDVVDAQLAEHSFMVHMQYGGEYMDENPITGKPGEFHLSSTGRKDKLPIPSIDTSFKSPTTPELLGSKKDGGKGSGGGASGAGDKTPKTPTGLSSKPKRKKSKAGATPTSS